LTGDERELDRIKTQLAAVIELLPGVMEGSWTNTGDMLASLRVRVKYLLFDSEATRRENKYLRELLDSRGKHDRPPSGTYDPA